VLSTKEMPSSSDGEREGEEKEGTNWICLESIEGRRGDALRVVKMLTCREGRRCQFGDKNARTRELAGKEESRRRDERTKTHRVPG